MLKQSAGGGVGVVVVVVGVAWAKQGAYLVQLKCKIKTFGWLVHFQYCTFSLLPLF